MPIEIFWTARRFLFFCQSASSDWNMHTKTLLRDNNLFTEDSDCFLLHHVLFPLISLSDTFGGTKWSALEVISPLSSANLK